MKSLFVLLAALFCSFSYVNSNSTPTAICGSYGFSVGLNNGGIVFGPITTPWMVSWHDDETGEWVIEYFDENGNWTQVRFTSWNHHLATWQNDDGESQ